MLTIDTKFFDTVEVDTKDVIEFNKPILGFDDYNKYALIALEDNHIQCLQSIDSKDICFLVSSPWMYKSDYEFDIHEEDKKVLDIDEDNTMVLNIINIPGDIEKMSINLMAPIIINSKTKKALQVVLHKSDYDTRHLIKT